MYIVFFSIQKHHWYKIDNKKLLRKSVIKNCILYFYAILYIWSTKILITLFLRTANHSDGLTGLAIIHS